MRSLAQNAELALLLEVTSTPKPGNVDRRHEYDDLRFEHFVAGAVGAQSGFRLAADGGPVGEAFERSVEGMADQEGGNTQFGALLLVTPLVATGASGELTPERASDVVSGTTVEDAANFYRAFEHVDVAVDEPPDDLDGLDVRRGTDAIPELEARRLTLEDVMELSSDVDGVAAEWVDGFTRSFEAAAAIERRDGPVPDRAAHVFLELLAEEVDTFVVTRNDRETAEEVMRRARAVLDGEEAAADLADEFVERDVNPGTTADIIAAALFIALERGLQV
ncbi:triphosphoribosyl-dephospho-CoA synthase [Halobacteria archaeon HArc-gm2]|nr:triphosphoribosyl-dephospho-CoA synthase [Halobacteria archaeon HArc-gm2]